VNDGSESPQPEVDPTLSLLRRATAGDQDAWHELFNAHQPLMRGVLRNRIPPSLRARFDMEDIMQSAFLTLSQQGGALELRDAPSFRAWLSRVLLNKLQDRLRNAARATRQGVRELRSPTEAVQQHADQGPSLEELAAQTELMARMYERILALPQADRDIVNLRFVDQVPWAEIARHTGLAESTVRRRYRELLENIVRGFL
jgi:RNA polymerase sigma-70 factor (ECF subfamily)